MPFQKGHKLSPGRPKAAHTAISEKMKADYVQFMGKHKDALMEAQLSLALGHYQEQVLKDGKTIVYLTEPDGLAIKDILDRAQGKATDIIDANLTGTYSLVELLDRAKARREGKPYKTEND